MIGLLGLFLTTAFAADIFVDVTQARAMVDASATIVDARGTTAWSTAHIQGAGVLDWRSLRAGHLRSGLLTPDLDAIEAAVEAAGISNNQPVLVYDAGIDGWGEAGRIFWMLEYLGHEDVHILDGGWPAWIKAGQPTESRTPTTVAGTFTPRPDPTVRSLVDEVEAHVNRCATKPDCGTVLWDTRTVKEFNGATPHYESRGGHIPGATHLWIDELRAPDGTLLPRDVLRQKLAGAGITPELLVIPHCTGGVRSALAYAVLRELDYARVRNFDGSMWEWTAESERPIVTP